MEKIVVNGVTFTQKLGKGEKWTCRVNGLFAKISDEGQGYWSVYISNIKENYSWYPTPSKYWKGLKNIMEFVSKFDKEKYKS